MHLSDLFIILFYLSLILSLGIAFGKSNSKASYFLGDKSIPWYFILLSIIATETSSLTFLNIPGISFAGDLSFLQIALGFIIGRFFVAEFLLPIYFQSGYSSIYELIRFRFGASAQKSVSSIFLITRVLGDGVRLYATSIPISILLKNSYFKNYSETEVAVFSLIIISIITTIYTVLGGFKSVVITDALQFLIYILGGVFVFVYLLQIVLSKNNFSEIINIITNKNKLQFYHGFEGNFFTSSKFFLNGLFAGVFISIGSHGVDQMFAQRLLACKSEKEGKLSLILSGIIVFIQFTLFLGIGLLLYIFFDDKTIPQDKVFSKFIIEFLPSPFLGIILAAILASAMSTLSSSINSMSMTVIYDWLGDNSKDKNSIFISLLWSIILLISSLLPYFLVSEGLVELGLKISSFFFGPLIGVFTYIRFAPSSHNLDSISCILAIFLSLIITILLNVFLKPALTFLIPIGIISFFSFIFIFNFYKKMRSMPE
jgi:SSS family transporter